MDMLYNVQIFHNISYCSMKVDLICLNTNVTNIKPNLLTYFWGKYMYVHKYHGIRTNRKKIKYPKNPNLEMNTRKILIKSNMICVCLCFLYKRTKIERGEVDSPPPPLVPLEAQYIPPSTPHLNRRSVIF